MTITKRKYALILISAALLIFSSCKKNDSSDDVVFIGENYFPMQVGDSLIYDVHVYSKDDLNEFDSTYQLLERVESIFTDVEGRPTFRLERYVRNTSNNPWIIYNVWTANVNSVQVEKKEDNITYIKLAFPTEENKTWNGNAKNANDPQDYKITSIHQPLTQGNLNFDSTLTVNQEDEDLFISKIFNFEKYGAGVGMIYKEQRSYVFDNGDTSAIKEYFETLISHN